MSQLDNSVNILRGISDKRAALYEKLSVYTVGDLLSHYPRDYIDFTSPVKIIDTEIEQMAVVKVTVEKKLKPVIRPTVNIYRLILTDGDSELLCTFWGQEYSYKRLCVGKEYLFYGKIIGTVLQREISSPIFIEMDDEHKIMPKYSLTKGLSNAMIMGNVALAYEMYDQTETLSPQIREQYGLCERKTAVHDVHFPPDMDSMKKARERLIFEELLVLQLGLSTFRAKKEASGAVMGSAEENIAEFVGKLPFQPTNAQLDAIKDCTNDMQKEHPMNRLLQGDVGSGKTLVAAAVCYHVHNNGYQSTIMAPTEILAQQHYDTLAGMLGPLGVKVVLLTGGILAAERRVVLEEIASGIAHVVVGTQALIQDKVRFSNLGFVVADEQHRFGVKQRGLLAEKGQNPHLLVMSATPIPRTLGLIIYGDLDISILYEMPKGRIPIRTYAVNTSYRERLYKFIIKYVHSGRQAYIVCPLVDEGASEKTSAVKYYTTLKESYFSDISVGLLHGRMKEKEKSAVMDSFKRNEISVLISTTVIEVGVDVPNAVVMLIENAEQFGLSQLHQLRGRVGRGKEESHCILMSDSKTPYTKARLDTMVMTSDGFEIANEDLKLRGPGDFFGAKQHGLPNLKIADMIKDVEVIAKVSELSAKILEQDSHLEQQENHALKEKVEELFRINGQYGFN